MMEFINKCKDFFIHAFNVSKDFCIHAFNVSKDFCINAFNVSKDFVLQCVEYVKANPIHGAIAGAILLLLILTICVARAKGKAKRKAKKQAKKAKKQAKKAKKQAKKQAKLDKKGNKSTKVIKETKVTKTQSVQTETKKVTMQEKRALELQINAEERAKKAAEEKARQDAIRKEVEAKLEAQRLAAEQEELALAKQEPTATIEETPVPVQEEVAPVVEEKPAPVQEEVVPVVEEKPAKKTAKLYEELKDAETEDDVWYDEDETDKAARYKGKWLICRMITDDHSEEETYFFELHASNGEKLLSSEEYTTYAGALRGIQTHKTNIEKGNFKITLSKKGDYIFKLLSGKNMLLCMGENYPTKARCEKAIESTVRFASTAVIDENVQDHLVKVPVEDETEIPAPTPNGKGKWIISSTKDADGQEVFYFELFANNGEKLLSSEEYTTYIGAVNGITTHKTNIEKDNFRISLTKRGDYIYKLLNGNGQLLCLGEHYKTKRLCQNAVESVKRFAKVSPILTDSKTMKS